MTRATRTTAGRGDQGGQSDDEKHKIMLEVIVARGNVACVFLFLSDRQRATHGTGGCVGAVPRFFSSRYYVYVKYVFSM